MIVGIYLAAGNSSRMGRSKLSLPLGGQCLGSYGLSAALQSNLDRVIVITREHDRLDWIDSNMRKNQQKLIPTVCETANLGQSHSLKTGVKVAQSYNADATVVMLADQPFVTKEIVNELIYHFIKKHPNYVAASLGGIKKPPILFNSSLYPSLLQIKGDQGARNIVRTASGLTIDYKNHKNFFDIDTPEDYHFVKKYFKKSLR